MGGTETTSTTEKKVVGRPLSFLYDLLHAENI